jgi:hypothetical protein
LTDSRVSRRRSRWPFRFSHAVGWRTFDLNRFGTDVSETTNVTGGGGEEEGICSASRGLRDVEGQPGLFRSEEDLPRDFEHNCAVRIAEGRRPAQVQAEVHGWSF